MGEYIDRGTFKKSVEERYCKPCKAEGKDHNGCWCRACWVDDMIDEVDCFQPADVAPVVHGHFVHDGPRFAGGVDWWRCSACGGLVSGAETQFAYCPNCGAKMDCEGRTIKRPPQSWCYVEVTE